TVAGGVTRVAGRAVIDRLGGGTPTLLVVEGGRPGERLRAASVAAGVEIEAAGRTFTITSERRDVVLTVTQGQPELTSA
ncbi:MAG: hypothetical protein AB1416_08615, partial [Actinomycetota bacterium]